MSAPPSCQAPLSRTLAGLGGPRCGAPATYRTRTLLYVCRDCGLAMKRSHEAGETVLSLLVAGKHGSPGEFPLYPIDAKAER